MRDSEFDPSRGATTRLDPYQGSSAETLAERNKAGEKKLDPNQKKALSDNFSSALGSVGGNPLAKEGVARMLGPKMGGIVGALIH